jgi:thiol-disulfide isomerase/thioredoxin
MRPLLRVLALAALSALGCRSSTDIAPEPSGQPASAVTSVPRTDKLRLVPSTGGDVAAVVQAAAARAQQEHRRVVVYVGASWCEPCMRFHHAAESGELDDTFPGVDFLTFDADEDGARLREAGYKSKLIPLFALPGPDGRSTGVQVEGGVKGDGAVANISPRLKELLAR